MLYGITADLMPGSTEEVRALQLKQLELSAAFYAAWNNARITRSDADAANAPEVNAARTAYDASVEQLEKLLGKDVPCHQVDYNLANLFSDAFKDKIGCRPHGIVFTRQGVLDWLESNNMQPVAA